jgi:signal transduction histidine kinase
VLAVLTMTTDKVVAANRLALLNQLAVVAQGSTSPEQAMAAAFDLLGAADRELQGGALYTRGRLTGSGAGPLTRTLTFGEVDPEVFPRVVDAPDHPVTRAWAVQRPTHRATPHPWAAVPVRGQDEVEAVLVLVPHTLRPYDEDHQRFVGLVGDQLGQILSLATARAREQARLDALAALDAAKTAFLSNVSHEFRTPLTLLLAPLEDVLNGAEKSIEPAEAEVMYASAHRLLRMVNALLDVARIEVDGLTAEPQPTDLAALTADLLHPFEDAAARTGLTFVAELDAVVGTVMADPELWEKVVLNLVANAIKFTHEGSVLVGLTVRDERLVLRVRDTGHGIPESELSHVFDRFHRVHTTDARDVQGTGIGLTIVAEAVRAMGGTATVTSEIGFGSTFEVTLPLVRARRGSDSVWNPGLEAAEALAREVSASTTDATGRDTDAPQVKEGRRAILVVEDNPAMRSRIGRLLRSLGHVVTADDGLGALEVLRSTHVDLVVTDVMMPRLDGVGLLKEIRADADLRAIPVIVLTARAGPEAAVAGIEAGADDYVVKPFTPSELLARCRTSLELSDYRTREAAAQVRGALLAGVSHDMQTPLAVITTSIGLLGEPDLTNEDRARIASRARARASQLTRLVTQFLDWSRLSMNQALPIRIERVDVAAVVRAVASEHDGVRVTGDEVAAEIACDRQRTEQILHNLVENAKRVASKAIEIRLGGDARDLTVRVVDDGPGVSREVLDRLFEAFGPSTAQKGSGLGLHVSRQAAWAQGGDLVLESTSAEGSVFLLSLPRHRSE